MLYLTLLSSCFFLALRNSFNIGARDMHSIFKVILSSKMVMILQLQKYKKSQIFEKTDISVIS